MQATVLAICQQLAIPALPQALAFERVYRALGPPSVNVDRPRDVIGRFHQYAHKESINSKAWEKGDLELDRSGKTFTLTTLRATLQRRAMLRPLLDKIKWGEPTGGGTLLHLIVKKKKKKILPYIQSAAFGRITRLFLFHGDGSYRDPKLAAANSRIPEKNGDYGGRGFTVSRRRGGKRNKDPTPLM